MSANDLVIILYYTDIVYVKILGAVLLTIVLVTLVRVGRVLLSHITSVCYLILTLHREGLETRLTSQGGPGNKATCNFTQGRAWESG